MYTLFIGDKAYSSWSLRGWLLLAAFDIPFRDVVVPMYDPQFDALKLQKAPARTVPILEWAEDGRTHRIWDTAAIAETLAERHPTAGIWPADAGDRQVARVAAAAMHSGFAALRSAAPMNIHRHDDPLLELPGAVEDDLATLAELWDWALAETGGPWLGGAAFSAADAFFAPVTFRPTGYALVRPGLKAYCDRLQAHAAVQRWVAEARANPRRIALYDDII